MFPQTHNNITGLELEQMLHFLSSNSPIPLPTSMDHHHHHHRSTNSSSNWKPHIEIAPNCPRCASTNTKFCYYNNYSLSQPRYFCKACRRYWTKGGSLRNVPVGGGCRKTRRSKSSRNLHSDRHGSEDIGIGDGDHQQNQTNASRDIDMAVVFAKFLNQNSTSGGESNNNNNNNNLSTTSESVETETENDAVVQPLMYTSDQPLVVGGGDTFEEMRTVDEVQNFGREELSLSGMDEFEGLLSVDEDVVQDILWSDHDHDAIVLSASNTWQQQQQPPSMMQMHELDQLVSYSLPLNEDCHELLHVNSSSTVNLISDSWSSWSSFDISNMEVFTSSSGGP